MLQFQFIFTIVLMSALGVILYLTAQALPRVEGEEIPTKKGLLEKWMSSGIPEKIDNFVNSFLEKFLRKAKIYLLKIDNFLAQRLNKSKINNSGNLKKENIDFKEVSSKNNLGGGIN